MAMRDILDRQASSIEYVLRTHGIRAQIDGGKLSARLAHFHIVLPQGVRAAQLAPLVPEIAEALGVLSCRLAPGAEGVYLEVPRPDPVPVRLLPLVQRVADDVPPVAATLGLDNDGMPLLLRLNSPDVEPVLLSGNPGAGKSGLLRGMALSLSLHNSPDRLRLLLLDCTGAGTAFRGLDHLPHLACPVAQGPVDSLVSLRWALRALTRRSHMITDEELQFDEDDSPSPDDDEMMFEYSAGQGGSGHSLVILIDGADELCATGNRRADAEAVASLNRLLAEGARHNIHMVVAAERPDQMVGIKANWGARLAGWVSSPEMARQAMGVKGSGAQGLLGGGDFLVALNAELLRFQAATISQGELARAVDLICETAERPHRHEEREAPMPARSRSGRNESPDREQDEPVQLRRSWVGE